MPTNTHLRPFVAVLLVVALVMTLLPTPQPALAQDDGPPALPQTIVTENGRYAADYPAAPWFAVEDTPNGLTITNDEALYTEGTFPPQSGQAALVVLFPEIVGDLEFTPEDSLDDVRAAYDGLPIENTFIAGRETVIVDLSDEETDFVFVFFRLPGAGLTIVAYATNAGELADYRSEAFAIIASVRTTTDTPTPTTNADPNALPVYRDSNAAVATVENFDFSRLPDLPGAATSNNGNVTIGLPEGYESFDDGNLVILPPGNATSGEIPSGQLAMYVISEQIDPFAASFTLAESGRGLALQTALYFRLVRTGITPRNFGPGEGFVVGDRAYDLYTFTSDFGDIAMIGFQLADGSPALMYALAAPGEMQEQLPTVIATAASLQLSE